MKPGLVQQTIRGVSCVKWTPGISRAYKDTTYSRTTRKVRYKLDCVRVIGKHQGRRVSAKYSWYQIPTATRAIKRALDKAGIPVHELLVFDDTIVLYQEFPLQLA